MNKKTKKNWNIFGIDHKDYYDIFQFQYNEYLKNKSSSMHAMICSFFAYHLYEWIFHHKKEMINPLIKDLIIDDPKHGTTDKAKFYHYLFVNCEYFEIINKICNGTKYFERIETGIENAGFSPGYGPGFKIGELYVKDNSEKILFKDLIKEVYELWKVFFEKYL